MDLIKENIIKICEEIIDKQGFFLVDLIIRGDQRKRIIEVYVDGEKNISAEDLSQLSRDINDAIEAGDIIKESYRLDVSSPGVDRPLKYLKQFPKHINRNFEITYKINEEVLTTKAKLISVERDELTFLSGKDTFLIKFNDIIKAKVLISFS
jgi:ribosome maturation factor RimP